MKLQLKHCLLFLFILIGIKANAQLTPACSATYSNPGSSWRISSFSVGNFIHNPNFNVNDYTSQSFDVDAGQTYQLTLISHGWCGVGVAADFNNDGDFDDPGELLSIPTYVASSPATYSFDITIPAITPSGSYRFRVFNTGGNSGGGTPANSPCGAYQYGSWHDYTVNVSNPAGCNPPSGLIVDNITPNSAEISWTASTSIPAPQEYIWKVITQGSDPDLVAGISNTTTNLNDIVNGLTNATDYDLYIKSNCGVDSSFWSFPVSFSTLCDGTPTAGVVTGPDFICEDVDFTLDLTGADEGYGVTYQWQSSPTGSSQWTDIVGETNLTTSLSINTETSFRVVITCLGSNLSVTSNEVTVGISPAVDCYCIPIYTTGCSYGDMIKDFVLNGENATGINDLNTVCAPNGYDDQTAQSVTLFQGVDYDAIISSGFSSSNARIWIDFNDNGIFEASESVALIPNFGSASTDFILPIPTNASLGEHRMRVRVVYSTSPANIDPCQSAGYGEVHDYTVEIIAPTGCIAPINTTVSNISNDGATISWTPSPLGTPFATFDYEVRSSGAADSGPIGLEASGTAQSDTFSVLTGLASGITYSLYVRTNCNDNTESNWTVAHEFILPEYLPIDLSGFSDDVIANGIGTANSSTTNDVDGVSYALVSQDFQLNATAPSPTQYLPIDGEIVSGVKWFQLADYSNNNSLRLNGGNQSGTLTFDVPKAALEVYVLGVSGSGSSNVTAEVKFTDNTIETFTGLSYPDWFSNSGNIVLSQVGRVSLNDNLLGTGGPQLFETVLEISTANENKQIESIEFTTASGSNVMNVLAISIKPNPPIECVGTPSSGTLNSPIMIACPDTPDFEINSIGATQEANIEYLWRSSPEGQNNWTALGSTIPSYTVSGQLVATDYQFIVTCVNSGLSDTTNITIGQYATCYCYPLSQDEDLYIDNFTTTNGQENISNLNSGYSTDGYGIFIEEVVSQYYNNAINFAADYGSGSNTYGLSIWVDWNQNGVFDGGNELVYQSSNLATSHTGSINVPINALEGETRMRIAISNSIATGPTDPCSTTNDGEYEDYIFNVLGVCVGPTVNLGNDTTICEGDAIVLDAGNPGMSYEWNDQSTNQQLTVDAAGVYIVTVNNGNCSTSDTVEVTVNTVPTGTAIQITGNGNGDFDFKVVSPIAVDNYAWDFGDGSTGTGPEVSHQYTESGTYNVQVVLSNDCGTHTLTESITTDVIGILDMENNPNYLSIYPNPTKDKVTFELKEGLNIESIEIYNIVGQLIYQNNQIKQSLYQFDASNLPEGIYTVKIITNHSLYFEKFKVNK